MHDRVLLYSADETAVRVEEVDLATGAKVATSNINLPGRMRYFSRQLNYLGDFNYLTGLPGFYYMNLINLHFVNTLPRMSSKYSYPLHFTMTKLVRILIQVLTNVYLLNISRPDTPAF